MMNKNISTYNYHYDCLTNTKSFKIRKFIKLCLVIIMFSLLSLFLYINIARKNNIKDTKESFSRVAYNSILKENDNILKKADFILNNKSKFTESELKIINDYAKKIKKEAVNTNNLVINLQNSQAKNKKYIKLNYNFVSKFFAKEVEVYFHEEYDWGKNNCNGDKQCIKNTKKSSYVFFTRNYVHSMDNVYHILEKYDKSMHDKNIYVIRSKRNTRNIINNYFEYYKINEDFIYLYDYYLDENQANISNVILTIIKQNNNLLDDIIKVGEINE